MNVLGISYRLRHLKKYLLSSRTLLVKYLQHLPGRRERGGGDLFCFSAVKLAGKVAFMTDAGNGENCSNFVMSRMEAPKRVGGGGGEEEIEEKRYLLDHNL
jgi:hypothetical protein